MPSETHYNWEAAVSQIGVRVYEMSFTFLLVFSARDDLSQACIISEVECPVTRMISLKDKEKRFQALSEMLRVLKPGGKFAIADLLSVKGVRVECSKPNYAYCPPITIVEGRKI